MSVRFFVKLYEAEVKEGIRYSSRTLAWETAPMAALENNDRVL